MALYPRLQDKIVLITGASSGIGEACARQFAASGSHLILGARRLEKLEQLKKELVSKHANIKVHLSVVDVRSSDSVTAFINGIPADMRGIDILINNAGLAVGVKKTHENSLEEIDSMIDTNVKGVLYMLSKVVPIMLERKAGHVVNVSSIAGLEAYKQGSVYCASKHAVQAITNSLRKELVDTPIRVTALCPGLVETEFSVVRFGGDKSKADSVYRTLGTNPLTGDDIADNILYITSRPPHVQISELIVFPTCQASTEVIHRV